MIIIIDFKKIKCYNHQFQRTDGLMIKFYCIILQVLLKTVSNIAQKKKKVNKAKKIYAFLCIDFFVVKDILQQHRCRKVQNRFFGKSFQVFGVLVFSTYHQEHR